MDAPQPQVGRPRSEEARIAVLHAVDDLLLEVGYAAMTMKGIAERAGVGRQTVYRWWSTKAEVLYEASMIDAGKELAIEPRADPLAEVTAYLKALRNFLTTSPAGQAYRALVAEAQQDVAVAALLEGSDVLQATAGAVVDRVRSHGPLAVTTSQAVALLVGPTVFWVMTGSDPAKLRPAALALGFARAVGIDVPTSDD